MIITESGQLGELLNFIESNEILALDIESTGLNTRLDQIIGFGLANSKTGYYVTHQSWQDGQLLQYLDKVACLEILHCLSNKKLVCYNGSFDLRFIKNYFGIDLIGQLHSDSMLLFHSTQEEGVPFSHSPFGLKSVAPYFFGSDVISEQHDMKQSIRNNGGSVKEFYKSDLEPMAKYCIQDAKLTIGLHEHLLPKLESEGLSKFYFQDEVMPLLKNVIIPMELRGIRVDVAALEKAKLEITEDLRQLEDRIQKIVKPLLSEFEEWYLDKEHPPKRTGSFAATVVDILEPGALPRTATGTYSLAQKHIDQLPAGLLKSWLNEECYLPANIVRCAQEIMQAGAPMLNLLSKHHLKKIFFDKLNEQPLSRTETGQPQVDEDFLDSVKSKYDWVPMLIEYNKLTKIKGTYIERFLDAQEDGIFYPSYKQHGTVSGRLSGDFQQLPRPLEEGDEESEKVRHYTNLIRTFFIARDGYILIDDDYESAEPRVFASISGEKGIQEIFEKGEDFYSKIALLVEGLHEFSADKKAPNYLGKLAKYKRQQAKVYALGIPYSMSGYKLQFEIGVPLQEAEALVKKYLTTFPKLKAWMDATYRQIAEQGWVKIGQGRVRHLSQAKKLYEKYGDVIFDDLALWKEFNEYPGAYQQAKKDRRLFKNLIASGLNGQVQGAVASMINCAQIAIARRFKEEKLDAYIVGSIHDEVLVECKEEYKERAAQIMQECMEGAANFDVPMVAKPSFGYNFKEAKG